MAHPSRGLEFCQEEYRRIKRSIQSEDCNHVCELELAKVAPTLAQTEFRNADSKTQSP